MTETRLSRWMVLLVAAAVLPAVAPALTAQEGAPPRVLATTPWTAAFARAAGAEHVDLLAPYEMRHPPEYELRATDLRRVEEADLVVYAGYETMMDRLERVLGEGAVSSVQIGTTHTRAAIEAAVMLVAVALGTEDQARRNVAEIHRFLDEWSAELRVAGLHRERVLVHGFQVPLMEDLGIPVAGRFGPGPLEAQQIVRLTRTGATIIVDNWHNEVAQPLRETLPDAPVVTFINFPGHQGTRTLLDVLRFNRDALAGARFPEPSPRRRGDGRESP
ncbi:MAG: ABC transporter substrate-binding protein [Spirochaetaceae bacterium]|nr:MAG: ABC transporter substrate-binding protein [Spirochaetaceae bacterium]